MLIAKSSSGGLTFLPILLVFALLYFFLLRPQQQRARRAREQVSTLEIGDEVVTTSGIIGRILSFDGDRAELEVAPGVIMTMLRAALTRRATDPHQAPPPTRRGGLGGFFAPPPGARPQARTSIRVPEPVVEEDDDDYEYEEDDDGTEHDEVDEGDEGDEGDADHDADDPGEDEGTGEHGRR